MQQANESNEVQHVDITPTWSGILPLMLDIVSNPKADRQAREVMLKEFRSMARAADLYNEHAKSESAS